MVPFLRRHIRSAHAMIASPLVELSIALVGDEEMSHLHQRFLDKSGPTDVLSFVLAQDGDDRPTSGEVVVCLPHARRRVARNRLSLRVEVLLYCLHGMLHLSGYDDRSPREYEIMHRTEDDILSRLGLPAAFALGSRVSP
jgi:probable rRNA maturation factor